MKSSLRGALTRERPLVLGALIIAVLWLAPVLGGGIFAQAPPPDPGPTVDSSDYQLRLFAEVLGAYGVAAVPAHLRTEFGNTVYVSDFPPDGPDLIHRFATNGTPLGPYAMPDPDSDP